MNGALVFGLAGSRIELREDRARQSSRAFGIPDRPSEQSSAGFLFHGMRVYGRFLLERALPLAFGGVTDYQFTADGLRCVISMPLSNVVRAVPKPGG